MPSTPEHFQESDETFLKNKCIVLGTLAKRLKKAEKLAAQRQETLMACRNWQEVQHEGELLLANLYRIQKGMHEIAVADWQREGQERMLTLTPRLAPHTQTTKLFRQSKKLRLGVPHAERMLRIADEAVQLLQNQLHALQNVLASDELERFCAVYGIASEKKASIQPVRKREPPKPYRTFITPSGMQIWVGKSAKNNEQLTFQCAKGSDWWLHASDCPGSHVVLRTAKNQDPTSEEIQDAAELALRFCKDRNSKEGVVAVTQVKYLSRVKGFPGKVLIPKHKILHIRLDEQRWERLRTCSESFK